MQKYTARLVRDSSTGECEPTSSKTRVEELVNDEEVELTNNDPLLKLIDRRQQLFNQPIPPIETYHVYDPRLPKELNEILGAMRLTKWQLKDIENYRAPSPREVSEPIRMMRPRRNPNKRNKAPPQFRLPMVDESMASIHALRRKHEPTKQKLPDPPKPSTKGKEKATGYTEDDIPRLREQWHDNYQDILQGTPEELLPLREVNHEINMIDPNKQYTYYLPRCPDAYKEAVRATAMSECTTSRGSKVV